MPSVSEQLRQAREAQKLTVYQVAEVTKVRTDHVRALDEGNFEVFSAPVYVRGFVRTYAQFLKLDVSSIMSLLEEELSHSAKHHEPPRFAEKKGGLLDEITLGLSKVNWRIVLPMLGVVMALLLTLWVYRSWRAYRARDPLAGVSPGLYQETDSNKTAGTMLPAPVKR